MKINRRSGVGAGSIFRNGAILLVAATCFASAMYLAVTAQAPAVDVVLRIQADGTAPFDATTFDPNNPAINGGTDANGNNGIVRLLDYVTYRGEVSVNDANQTNIVVRFTADTDQKWTAIPDVCQKTENNPSINPTSEIVDLASSGDKRVLVCNIGAQPQGTKLVIKPVAQVKGLGTNATLADKAICDGVPAAGELDPSSGCVSAFATIQSSEHTAQVESNYVSVLTTAAFKINMTKTSPPLSVNPAPAYGPKLRNQPGPAGLNIGNGQVVEWVITAQAAKGSEPIKPDANGQRDFVLTDTFVDDNPNNNVGAADGSSNANRSSNARLFSWNGTYPACQAIGTEIGTITCTQGGGSGAGLGQNGAPIIITLNNVNVTYPEIEGQVFKFRMRLWVPINSNAASPNNHDIMSNTGLCTGSPVACTTNVTNRITGLDTPNPALDGASPVITSPTNQQNYSGAGEPGGAAPGSGNNLFTVPVDSNTPGGGPFMVGGKSFDADFVNGANHPGTKTVSPGEIVPLGLNSWGNGLIIDNWLQPTGYTRICDPIDTSSFEFAGTPADGEQHPFPYWGSLGSPYNPAFMNNTNIKGAHTLWDGNGVLWLGAADGTAQMVSTSQLTKTKFILEYTDTAHVNDPLSLRDYNCNSGQNWVTDPATLPGGEASVTAIRMTFTNIDAAEIRALHDISADEPNIVYAYSFHYFKVKNTATGYSVPNATIPGNYLPNFSQTIASVDGTTDFVTKAALSSTDTTNADFSRNSYFADRLRLVSAKMGITKELADQDKKVIRPAETATFKVTPYLLGQYAAPVDITITDTYPATPSQMTFVSAEVDPACSTTNGTYGTFNGGATSMNVTITGVTAGQPICPLLITLRAPLGAKAGNYLNSATITSSDTQINNNSLDPYGQLPKAATSVVILATDGYYVEKSKDRDIYEVNEAITQRLTYTNLGSENYTAGNFIDILPFVGDSGAFTLREDTLTPNEDSASTYTHDDTASNDSVVGLASIPTGTNGETFYYTTVNPSTIPIDPCHSANQPAGFVPSATNGIGGTVHYCYQAYLDNGNLLPDGAPTGSGVISWSSTAPANLNDVTAIRWDSTAHVAGSAARTVVLELQPLNNLEGDIYCNNFSGRIPQIALDIRSNDVCERVVAGTIAGTIFSDGNASGDNFAANSGDGTYEGIRLRLLNGDGSVYDSDPATAGIQEYVVTTNVAGFYQFVGLPSGDYRVSVVNPPTTTQAYDLDDTSPPIPASFATPNDSGMFTLAGPSTASSLTDVDNMLEVDFSYTGTASLGGKVWFDENKNGQRESGEEIFDGVKVYLLDEDGNPVDDPSTSMPWVITTDASGDFLFADITPGKYRLDFDLPEGYTCTSQRSGASATDSDGNPSNSRCMTGVVTVLAGDFVVNIDLGLVVKPASIVPGIPNTGIGKGLTALVGVTLVVMAASIVAGRFRRSLA